MRAAVDQLGALFGRSVQALVAGDAAGVSDGRRVGGYGLCARAVSNHHCLELANVEKDKGKCGCLVVLILTYMI